MNAEIEAELRSLPSHSFMGQRSIIRDGIKRIIEESNKADEYYIYRYAIAYSSRNPTNTSYDWVDCLEYTVNKLKNMHTIEGKIDLCLDVFYKLRAGYYKDTTLSCGVVDEKLKVIDSFYTELRKESSALAYLFSLLQYSIDKGLSSEYNTASAHWAD
ncbi:hypothetical protein AGMMS50249_3700 [candidate division SR1 bacterium]|nr:hypothetical protein AGMMS50249_3700 [candidate division SR1 bacterium]